MPVRRNIRLNIDFAPPGKIGSGVFFRVPFAPGRFCRGMGNFCRVLGNSFHFSSNAACEKAAKMLEKSGSARHNSR